MNALMSASSCVRASAMFAEVEAESFLDGFVDTRPVTDHQVRY
jgi:hypothetical protein